jgi:hypothetical protein
MTPHPDSPYVSYLQAAHNKLSHMMMFACQDRNTLEAQCVPLTLSIGEMRALIEAARDILASGVA